MPWPLRKGTSRRTTSQRFGLNPMTAAPAKIATTAKTLRDTYAGYAAVTSEGGRQRSSCRMVWVRGKRGLGDVMWVWIAIGAGLVVFFSFAWATK
jgi:hypothetical protein